MEYVQVVSYSLSVHSLKLTYWAGTKSRFSNHTQNKLVLGLSTLDSFKLSTLQRRIYLHGQCLECPQIQWSLWNSLTLLLQTLFDSEHHSVSLLILE